MRISSRDIRFLTSEMAPLNPARVFALTYCGLLAAIIAVRHRDQLRFLQLIRPVAKTSLLLGVWRVPRLTDFQFSAAGAGLVLSLVAAAAGIFTKISLLTALCAYFAYFGQIQPLAYAMRKTYMIPQVLLLLVAAPGIDRSLHSQAPVWPLLIIEGILAHMYLTSAFCKLRAAGWSWASWKTMESVLLSHDLTYGLPFSRSLSELPWACGMLSAGTLTFELTFCLVVLVPKLALVWAAFGLLFHTGARFLMRIDYLTYHAPLYSVFIVGVLCRYVNPA